MTNLWAKLKFWSFNSSFNVPGRNFCQLKTLIREYLGISENLRSKDQGHVTRYGKNTILERGMDSNIPGGSFANQRDLLGQYNAFIKNKGPKVMTESITHHTGVF